MSTDQSATTIKLEMADKLESYALVWLLGGVYLSAVALVVGVHTPTNLIYTYLHHTIFNIAYALHTPIVLVSGLAAAFLLYRWHIIRWRVFGEGNLIDRAAVIVLLVFGFDLVITLFAQWSIVGVINYSLHAAGLSFILGAFFALVAVYITVRLIVFSSNKPSIDRGQSFLPGEDIPLENLDDTELVSKGHSSAGKYLLATILLPIAGTVAFVVGAVVFYTLGDDPLGLSGLIALVMALPVFLGALWILAPVVISRIAPRILSTDVPSRKEVFVGAIQIFCGLLLLGAIF